MPYDTNGFEAHALLFGVFSSYVVVFLSTCTCELVRAANVFAAVKFVGLHVLCKKINNRENNAQKLENTIILTKLRVFSLSTFLLMEKVCLSLLCNLPLTCSVSGRF